MSHGETFRVAKLAFESTTLPLLTTGCRISAGFLGIGSEIFDRTRDMFEGTGAGVSSVSEASDSMSGSADSRRLFLDVLLSMASYDGELLLEDACKGSLSDFGDEWDECRAFSCGMAAGSEL